MESTVILSLILIIAVLGRANSVAIAACLLIIIKLISVEKYIFPFIEKWGITWGVAIITASILMPIAKDDITYKSILHIFTSWISAAALLLSLFTTYLSGQGLQYLTVQGHSDVMPSLIAGAVIAAAFLGGVPVGPLIASGMLALVVKFISIKNSL